MIYLLPQLVDRAADRAADHEAFCGPGERLTYGDLVRRANRLAHALVGEGVRRGDRVGVFMPRCLESAVAVYGILKSGAAFVPIDPHTPVGGLRRLIDDCGLHHLVTHDAQRSSLSRLAEEATPLRSIVGPTRPIEGPFAVRSWADLATLPAGSGPDVGSLEDDLAYIMYSSGSTGRPKGIMHTHRSGLAYAHLSVSTYDVGPDDRIGNHSPLHFDMSTFGYLSAPLAGATTLLIPEAYTKLTASLSRLMETERLTIWYSVPLALIQLLLRGVLESRGLDGLRWVLFGGEPFARKHLRQLMARWPRARFSNVYGPAEVNQCTFHHLPPNAGPVADSEVGDSEPVPIGKTWDNTESLVLDEHDQPVAQGEVGELLIRSATMMRGYWGRPELDADAFYRQPAAGGMQKVFYRTGDLVRRTPEGELLFLGRKDRQVKVRGYRVELDEIERALAAHEAVAEAAVYPVRVDGPVEHLRAAVRLKPEGPIEPAELRAAIAHLLPAYAVPEKIEIRDALPRTASDKIDRRTLQQLAEAAAATADRQAPEARGAVE
ncbi:MAG: amino acid adenylation domain-containing protein [Acidobacteriota bacterium]